MADDAADIELARIEPYARCRWRVALFALLCIASAGTLYLLSRWFPRRAIRLVAVRTSPARATHVLVSHAADGPWSVVPVLTASLSDAEESVHADRGAPATADPTRSRAADGAADGAAGAAAAHVPSASDAIADAADAAARRSEHGRGAGRASYGADDVQPLMGADASSVAPPTAVPAGYQTGGAPASNGSASGAAATDVAVDQRARRSDVAVAEDRRSLCSMDGDGWVARPRTSWWSCGRRGRSGGRAQAGASEQLALVPKRRWFSKYRPNLRVQPDPSRGSGPDSRLPLCTVRYFTYRKLRYILNADSNAFVPSVRVAEQTITPLESDIRMGLSDMQHRMARLVHGPNDTDLQLSPILRIIFTEAVHPFYVFQMLSVTLWVRGPPHERMSACARVCVAALRH